MSSITTIDEVNCLTHKKQCMLKTGVKPGQNFGRNYYLCAHQPDRCDFVKEISYVGHAKCQVHPGELVELQTLHYTRNRQETRQYFRCNLAKAEKKHFCGHVVLEEGVKQPTPLKDRDQNKAYNAVSKSKKTSDSEEPCDNRPPVLQGNIQTVKVDSTKTQTTRYAQLPMKARDDTHMLAKAHLTETQSSKPVQQQTFDDQDVSLMETSMVSGNADVRPKERNPLQTSVASSTTSTQSKEDMDISFAKLASIQASKPKELSESFSDMNIRNPAFDRVKNRGQNESMSSYRDSSVVEISSDEDDDNEGYGTASEGEEETGRKASTAASESSSDSDEDFVVPQSERPAADNNKLGNNVVGENTEKTALTTKDLSQTKSSGKISDRGLDQPKQVQPMIIKTKDGRTVTVPAGNVTTSTTSSGIQVIKVTKPIEPGSAFTYIPTNTSKVLAKNVAKRAELVRVKENQTAISKRINLSALPDKGAKIKTQIDMLGKNIEELDAQIKKDEIIVAKEKQLQASHPRPGGAQVSLLTGQVKTASGQILPTSSTKQTKMTDHAMVTALPAHVYQQLYAANPQLQTLYGGRMTEARQREVGSVTAEAIERLHKQLETCPTSSTYSEDPEGIKVPLMPHQKHALAWLSWREKQHPPGGILADDMGLGKTLTMISMVAKEKAERTDKKDAAQSAWLKKMGDEIIQSQATLIVCPASVIHQWAKEIERRCQRGLLRVIIYHGPNREKDIRILADADIVLTTYNIISKDVGVPEDMKKDKNIQDMPASDLESGKDQPPLLKVAWERVILDEGHSIKNHKSLTAMSVCRLRARYRWALTGTPIQNDLLDMYSLLRFIRCSPFDEYKVWKRQVDNKSSKGTQRLNTLVRSLLLRRTKEDKSKEDGKPIVSLPPKTMHTHELELGKAERIVYDRIFQQSKSTLQNYLKRQEAKEMGRELGSSSGGTNPWGKEDVMGSQKPGFVPAGQLRNTGASQGAVMGGAMGGSGGGQRQTGGTQILLLLLRLRQCCSHLTLMKDGLDMEELQTDGLDLDIVEQMQQMALQEDADLSEPEVKKSSDLFKQGVQSTKIKAILKGIQEIQESSSKKKPMKSVIVSQWTKMLDVVEYHLKQIGVRCCTIRGNVPPKTRAELVDSFNCDPTGPEVMLVSLRAGGVGLNLIGGNHMFLIDMHWNPALEQQACDRVYRMGQLRDVFVHRFICKDTVEEKILQLQKKKLSLAENVLTGAGASANKLTLADLRMLFGLDMNK